MKPERTDTDRLNWLIDHGYTPARWRSWAPGDPPSPNGGGTRLGRGGREEIDVAMDRAEKCSKQTATPRFTVADIDGFLSPQRTPIPFPVGEDEFLRLKSGVEIAISELTEREQSVAGRWLLRNS